MIQALVMLTSSITVYVVACALVPFFISFSIIGGLEENVAYNIRFFLGLAGILLGISLFKFFDRDNRIIFILASLCIFSCFVGSIACEGSPLASAISGSLAVVVSLIGTVTWLFYISKNYLLKNVHLLLLLVVFSIMVVPMLLTIF